MERRSVTFAQPSRTLYESSIASHEDANWEDVASREESHEYEEDDYPEDFRRALELLKIHATQDIHEEEISQEREAELNSSNTEQDRHFELFHLTETRESTQHRSTHKFADTAVDENIENDEGYDDAFNFNALLGRHSLQRNREPDFDDVHADRRLLNYDRSFLKAADKSKDYESRVQEASKTSVIKKTKDLKNTGRIKSDTVSRFHYYQQMWAQPKPTTTRRTPLVPIVPKTETGSSLNGTRKPRKDLNAARPTYVVPTEKRRDDLRWAVRTQIVTNAPVTAKPAKKLVPNTYVPPTEQRRDALRWAVRADCS